MDPSKWNSESHMKETTVFTRYLPLVSAVVFTWPFAGVGSAHVTRNIYKHFYMLKNITSICCFGALAVFD